MKWVLGDILAVPADYLVSSGNVQLNMSGGVNGALLQKYGVSLQVELHAVLTQRRIANVPPGYCLRFVQPIGDYRGVVYAVGIDGFYDSSVELVRKTLAEAVRLLDPEPGSTVAIPAIATGYGHLSKFDFGRALPSVLDTLVAGKSELRLVDRSQAALDEIRAGLTFELESSGRSRGEWS